MDILQIIETFFHLLAFMSPYMLIGFVLAGIMHAYVPETWIVRHLGGKGVKSVFNSSLLGLPLPLCSCGVIPLAANLKRQGASKGAISSFLITTPMSGMDSILATYGVLGAPMALYRLFSTFMIGLAAGILTNLSESGSNPSSTFMLTPPNETDTGCSPGCCGSSKPAPHTLSKPAEILHYAFGDLFADIAKPFMIGLALGALLLIGVGDDFSALTGHSMAISYLIILLIGIPVYTCSLSAIPVSLALLGMGFSPGAAFLYLITAPATNAITIGIVYKLLEFKALLIYLVTIILGSLFFAMLIDIAWQSLFAIDTSPAEMKENPGLIEILSALAVAGLYAYHYLYLLLKKRFLAHTPV